MHQKITNAKVDVILDPGLCFFASLICNLRFIEDKTCETAWTDGTSLGYNPEYIDGLSHAQVVGLLAHEVMHCAAGHPWRRDGREPFKWNVACDLAINYVIRESGLTLPDGSLDADNTQKGKSAEWIYDRLPNMPPPPKGQGNGKGQGQGNGQAPGEVRDSPGNTSDDPTEAPMTEGEWNEITKQAAAQAKARGNLPAGLDRFAKSAVAPKIDWKAALRKFVEMTARNDYTWSRPSTRYISQGFYMPSLYSEETKGGAFAQDTSGSMDGIALNKGLAELKSIFEETRPEYIELFFCDASVGRHVRFERGEEIEWRPCGGGGTDFRPVFDAISKLDEQPTYLIFVTDLYGSFPAVAPDYPVMWLTDNDQIAPFGETLKID